MKQAIAISALLLWSSTFVWAAEKGDAGAGARAFQACAACHSLERNRNMTGPSLSGVLNRKAGTLPTFSRYSDAMKQSGVVWNDENLDRYLENPARFVPGNHMIFPGVPDGKTRADIIAFLKQAGNTSSEAQKTPQGQMGMMGGMQPGALDLKTVDASSRVKVITYCSDTFKVTTEDGKSRDFWERNLRFKTDSSGEGPNEGKPVIMAAGMMGDRASIIFSSPEEISRFIARQC